MIPWFESHAIHIGFITLQTWGVLVGLGYALGTLLAYRRAKKNGLDAERVLDLSFWMFIGAFIGARLFEVLFYDPAHYWANPLDAINPFLPGWSMFGGLLGGAAAFTIGIRKYKLNWMAFADTMMWGLPWGCGVGRIGCFLIHDHPGTLSHSLLAVKYPDGQTRHDHGLYLSLIGFATGILFLWLSRKPRKPGFWLGSYMMIEGCTRFVLDFYRIVDATYWGLTPTQYLAVPMLLVGAWLIRRSTD
ncbi:MAG: prolipoprotein diacylglyceryl transferase [Candidatus Uhrbacteria bacterium]